MATASPWSPIASPPRRTSPPSAYPSGSRGEPPQPAVVRQAGRHAGDPARQRCGGRGQEAAARPGGRERGRGESRSTRPEERRVGKEGVSESRTRWLEEHETKKKI